MVHGKSQNNTINQPTKAGGVVLIYLGPSLSNRRLGEGPLGPKPGQDPLSTHGRFHGRLQKGGGAGGEKLPQWGKLVQTKPTQVN